MRIVGISGSPRSGGNSDILLDEALKGARSAGAITEKIDINGLEYRPCQECGGCDINGKCVIRDGMRVIYEKFEEQDAFIVASPIFFGSLSAQLKAMIDRFQCGWISKYVLRKAASARKRRKGAFICVSGSDRPEYFENARQIIKLFFATLDIDYAGELYCGGVNTKGSVIEKLDVMKKAFDLGLALVKG